MTTMTSYYESPTVYRRRRLLGIVQRAADRLHRREARMGYDDTRTDQALRLLSALHRAAVVE